MRILANENFPLEAVRALKKAGHEVTWVHDILLGSRDEAVLLYAQEQNCILITFDKDFGELAFKANLPATCGIVLFRISMSSPEYIAQTAVIALGAREDWAGHFSVVEDRQIRMTPLPQQRP